MACGGCLQMRHAMIRIVAGPRIADKLVPGARVYIEPPKDKPKETIVRRSVIVRAKPGK